MSYIGVLPASLQKTSSTPAATLARKTKAIKPTTAKPATSYVETSTSGPPVGLIVGGAALVAAIGYAMLKGKKGLASE